MVFNKKRTLPALVFILLGISIIYRVFHPFEQARVETLTYTGAQQVPAVGEDASGNGMIPDIQDQKMVQEFIQKPRVAGAVHKNLFTASSIPAPGQDSARMPAPAKETVDIPADNPIHINVDPKEQVWKDIASYRFYGTYDSDAGGAVFMTRDDQVIVAKEGDTIDGKYLIEEIRKTHIRITALHVNETIHLDMREFNNE